MVAISNSLNVHNLPIFQPISMILVSKFMVYRALSDRTYLLLGVLSPLIRVIFWSFFTSENIYREILSLINPAVYLLIKTFVG